MSQLYGTGVVRFLNKTRCQVGHVVFVHVPVSAGELETVLNSFRDMTCPSYLNKVNPLNLADGIERKQTVLREKKGPTISPCDSSEGARESPRTVHLHQFKLKRDINRQKGIRHETMLNMSSYILMVRPSKHKTHK